MVINDETVNDMILYLKERGLCSSSIRSHAECYEDLRIFLKEHQFSFDEYSARSWISDLRTRYERQLVRAWSEYLEQLCEFNKSGMIADRHFFLDRSAYDRLEGEFKSQIDEYLESCRTKYSDRSWTVAQIYLSEALLFFTDQGRTSVEEISYSDLKKFIQHDFSCSDKTRAAIIGHLRHLFEFMFKKGKCSEGFHIFLNEKYSIYIKDLENFSAKNHRIILSAASESKEFPLHEYRDAMDGFFSLMDEKKYAYTAKRLASEVLFILYVFLDINELGYHPAIADAWLNEMKPVLPHGWKNWRRMLSLFYEYTENGGFYTERFIFSPCEIDSLPEWMADQIRGFQKEKEREFRSPETVRKIAYPCVRLCRFLDERGCQDFTELDSKLLKEFCLTDKHMTPKGRRSCLTDVRQFVIYLENHGIVNSKSLHLCIPTDSSSDEKIVDVLTDDQVAAIDTYRRDSRTPIELRSSAIVLLGLKTGLRSCDIVNLKFTDINWKNQTISVVQKKTQVAITLPMPVDVGNAIYRYISCGRPEVDSNYIFVQHKAPYDRLSEKICANSLLRILPERSEINCGFHVTRRTLATSILQNGSGAQTVMDVLGHTDPTSVMKYLAMDEEHMRMCPLSLQELCLDWKEAQSHE